MKAGRSRVMRERMLEKAANMVANGSSLKKAANECGLAQTILSVYFYKVSC